MSSQLATVAPPSDLSEIAAQAWTLCVTEMGANRALREPDLILLRGYCETVDVMEQAAAHVREHGAMMETPVFTRDGDEIGTRWAPNPAVRQHKDALTTLRLLSEALGLNPIARIRAGLMELAGASMVADIRERLLQRLTTGGK